MTTRPRGRSVDWRAPNPRRTMVNVRLTDAEVAALDALVSAVGTDRSAVLRGLLAGAAKRAQRKARRKA